MDKRELSYIKGDIGYICIGKEQWAMVDADDFDRVNSILWCAHYCESTNSCYAINRKYCEIKGARKIIRMHRFVMNCPDDKFIDHIKHNTLDNRKSQLRVVTKSQNAMNIRSNNKSSGHTGVSWNKRENKWRSYIKINGYQKHLGYFIDKDDAIKARKDAEEKYFGEFSYDNSVNKQLEKM